jgi:hypothetical protein
VHATGPDITRYNQCTPLGRERENLEERWYTKQSDPDDKTDGVQAGNDTTRSFGLRQVYPREGEKDDTTIE